jgi:hypothetical protein
VSARPAEFPGSRDGRLLVRTTPGGMTLTRDVYRFGSARTVMVAGLSLGLCIAILGVSVRSGAFGIVALLTMIALGLLATALYTIAVVHPEVIEIAIDTRGIIRTSRACQSATFRGPAIVTLTPLMGSRAHYRGEPQGPQTWQWLMLISSLLDGPVEQMLVGAEAVRDVSEAINQVGPEIAQFGSTESTLLPWVTVCPQCAYDLIGIGQPRCPECGLPISPDNLLHLTALAAKRRSLSP